MTDILEMAKASGAVVILYGPQPMDIFSKVLKLAGKDAVLDQQVANMAGAMTVAGSPAAIAALKARLYSGAVEASKQEMAGAVLPPGAVEWLGSGERGTSSETMFSRLSGVDVLRGARPSHPHDPPDFRRCELLLDAVPDFRTRLAAMREASPEWGALVGSWDEIVQTFDAECPAGWRGEQSWSAPKTYALMRRLIESARVSGNAAERSTAPTGADGAPSSNEMNPAPDSLGGKQNA